MGVDVASFGDYFADKRVSVKSRSAELVTDEAVLPSNPIEPAQPAVEITVQEVPPVPESKSSVSTTRPVIPPPKPKRSADEPIKCLVYNDPFGSTYKKYIFTADGKYLLGGMMIGDIGDFVKLVAIVKKKVLYHPLLFPLFYIAGFMFFVFLRKHWMYHRHNLSSVLKRKGITVKTLMKMPKFVAAT